MTKKGQEVLESFCEDLDQDNYERRLFDVVNE